MTLGTLANDRRNPAVTTATDRSYGGLRSAILEGRLAPGKRLQEVKLAEWLHVSRTPVREALRALALEGLVEVTQGKGARVVSWSHDELEEIFGLRAELEGYGAARAAERRTSDDLDRLHQILVAMDKIVTSSTPEDLARSAELNNRFHSGIVAASHNRRLAVSLSSLIHLPLILQTYTRFSPAELVRSQSQHRDLFAAIRTNNAAWARSTMSAHIWAGHASYTGASIQQSATVAEDIA